MVVAIAVESAATAIYVGTRHHITTGRIMTTHSRGVSATIDPVKLDRLAEVAIKVGLQLQP
ncbi:MAG: aminopeptidase, partial [Mesorhizobium sp.]